MSEAKCTRCGNVVPDSQLDGDTLTCESCLDEILGDTKLRGDYGIDPTSPAQFTLAKPRTPEEFAAAEKLEALGFLALNADGSFTLTEKGLRAESEFFAALREAMGAAELEEARS